MGVLAVVLLATWVGPLAGRDAAAVMLCAKKRGGALSMRETCKRRQTAVDVTEFIEPGSVTGEHLADGGVGSADIADGGVGSADLADGAVGTNQLADGGVTEPKLASGVVQRFLSFSIFAVNLSGLAMFDTGSGAFAGIDLPDGGNGIFDLGFTVPPNHTAGMPLTLHIVWHVAETACAIRFRANYLSVGQVGKPHPSGGGATSGLTVVGGEVLTAPATANDSTEALVTIESPDPAAPIQPGDAVNFGLFRSGVAGDDTCAQDMVIQGLWLEYV